MIQPVESLEITVLVDNVTDPAMAKEMLEALPLGREHLMSFELVPLGPLTPLRQLPPAHL